MLEFAGMIFGGFLFSIISIFSYFIVYFILSFIGINEMHIIPVAAVSGVATAIGCHIALIVQTYKQI